MSSLKEHIVSRIITESGEDVTLNEGVANIIRDHPYMSSMVAGYFLSKALKKTAPASTIDVVTQRMKFYAHTTQERKLQKAIVDSLLSSGHFALITARTEKDAFVWTIKRTGR